MLASTLNKAKLAGSFSFTSFTPLASFSAFRLSMSSYCQAAPLATLGRPCANLHLRPSSKTGSLSLSRSGSGSGSGSRSGSGTGSHYSTSNDTAKASISPQLVKQLRETSGAPMMECKKALVASKGDLSEAENWLREHSSLVAAKKAASSGRSTGEGVIAAAVDNSFWVNAGATVDSQHDNSNNNTSAKGEHEQQQQQQQQHKQIKAALVEVKTETDFAARDPEFKQKADSIAARLLQGADRLELEELVTDLGRRLREKIVLGRTRMVTVTPKHNVRRSEFLAPGIAAAYVHGQASRIAAIVAIDVMPSSESQSQSRSQSQSTPRKDIATTSTKRLLEDLREKLALQIVGASPKYATIEDVPQDVLKREEENLMNDPSLADKPEEVKRKIAKGKMQKFYEEHVLTEQLYVMDSGSMTESSAKGKKAGADQPLRVRDIIAEAQSHIGHPLQCRSFARLELGEDSDSVG